MWQSYLASGSKVAPDVKTKVNTALGAFQTLSSSLSASPGSIMLTGAVNDALAACDAVLRCLPRGTLPPNIAAAVTIGEIVARAVLALVEQQVPAPK